MYDIIVVGNDAAAAASALRAAASKARTLLLDTGVASRPCPTLEWLGPKGIELCREFGVVAKKIDAAEFAEFRLHSWDLRRASLIKDKDYRGWIVAHDPLAAELRRLAIQKGARHESAKSPVGVALADDRVVLRFADRPEIAGGVLLISGELGEPLASMANLVPADRMRDVADCLFVEYETTEKPSCRLDVVIGASRTGQLAVVLRHGAWVSLRLVTRGGDPIERQFAAFRLHALESGLLPAGAPEKPFRCCSPGGIALDMETHAGKRTLLFGAAGGFVCAFSHESLYPSMASGRIAADTAIEALAAALPQDRLGTFGAIWRGALADYLRMPNTDLSLLVPLVFNNEQMAKRVARAFLLGQPF